MTAILCIRDCADAGEKLDYRLKWLFNTSTVGDLYADTQGFFKNSGLDVTVKAGGPERDAIRELELGHADFGVASADQVIRALSKGAKVVVIAQLFQVNPLQWIYRAGKSPLKSPEDLKGKTIGITYGGNDEIIMRTLLAKAKLGESDVKFFSVRQDYTPFYQNKVTLWPVYRNAQAPILEDKLQKGGESLMYFNPADFGVQFVANSVVTSERMIAEHPEIVRKFIKALLSAWEQAVDPVYAPKALQTLEQFDRDTPADIRKKQLMLTREIVKPKPDTIIGRIDIAAWQQTEAIMSEQHQIPARIDISHFLKEP
ncbi:MAG: ABC transporter substrate-binding protein [Desulfobacteraceae bacterium]|nr:ABC transporter substrate-binding protein [Desulfobacteraceae bacterium]